MSTYAIIETGGKQYRVEEGQSLLVDRLPEDEGAKVPLRAVMLRTDDDVVLQPGDLEKVKVEAKVAGHERGEKVKVFKYKAKKGYRRRQGHRSELTRLEVTEVKQLSRKPAKKAAPKKAETETKAKSKADADKPAPKKKAASEKKKPAAKKAAPKKKSATGKTEETEAKPAAKKTTAKKTAAKKAAPKKKAPAKKAPAKKADSEKEG